jgi:hypothetical protein
MLSNALALILLSTPHTPAFLPRGASLGLFVNSPVIAPHLRLQWEFGIFSEPRSDILFFFNLGTGIAASLPTGMQSHFQHVALLGVAYRSNRETWQWGFQIGAGPLWYQTAYLPGVLYPFENRVVGYAEGQVRLGYKLFPGAYTGIYAGYGSPWEFNTRFPGTIYSGGIDVGLYLDWR